MNAVQQVIDGMLRDVSEDARPHAIVKAVRKISRITCRELGCVLGLSISQIADIEAGRLKVSEDVYVAWFMVCGSRLVVHREMAMPPGGSPDERPGCGA